MKHYLALLLVFSFNYLLAQYPLILSQREQAKVIDEILDDRLRNTLPALMRREGSTKLNSITLVGQDSIRPKKGD